MELKASVLQDLMDLKGAKDTDLAEKEEQSQQTCLKGKDDGGQSKRPNINRATLSPIKEEAHAPGKLWRDAQKMEPNGLSRIKGGPSGGGLLRLRPCPLSEGDDEGIETNREQQDASNERREPPNQLIQPSI